MDKANPIHNGFLAGVREVEGKSHGDLIGGGPVLSDDVQFNPSVSGKQRRYMGAALARKQRGVARKNDPKMAIEQLREFARK